MRQAWKTLRRIVPYLLGYKKLAAYSVFFTLVAAGVSLLLPWPLALIFDSVLGDEPLPGFLAALGSEGRITLLVLLTLAGLALTAGQGIINVVNEYVTTRLDQRLTLDFRSDLFRHAHRLGHTYYEEQRAGGLAWRITHMAAGAGAVVVSVPPLLEALLTLIGMLVIAYTINSTLALLSLSVVPFVYYSTGYYARRIEPRLVKVREMEGETISIVQEAMAMLRVVIPFGREPYEYQRFRGQGEKAVDARVGLTVRQTVFASAINLITGVGTAIVLGFGAYLILQGQLSAGELLVMMTYIAKVYAPLQTISTTISQQQEQYVNVRGALQLLDETPEVEDEPGAFKVDRVQGGVTFEGVSFNYKRRTDTLKDISFGVQAGDRVAIVGPTGAGKTTLMGLLTRFYDPSEGRILLDEIDLRKLTLKSLREQISTVMQEPLLFSGSIADNIRYGRLDASTEEVIEAAKAANAHDFIMRLPEGYDTTIGERGSQLSGGERQRISIARAFVKDAPLLILDEPTSSIDSKTEAVILDSLERLMVGRTTFMIAHRLSTVRSADFILVLNQGRLIEQGTHDELLRREGLYRQLHDVQTGRTQHTEELLRHFERLELDDQDLSVSSLEATSELHRNGDEREAAFRSRDANIEAHQPRSESDPHSAENAIPRREMERAAEPAVGTFVLPHQGVHTLPLRTRLSLLIRKRLWFILLVATCLVGTVVGLSLMRLEYEGASALMLSAGLALAAGLTLGVGLAALLEYLDNVRTKPFKSIRKRLWFVLSVAVWVAGTVVGLSLMWAGYGEVSAFMLNAGLALMVGLAFGVGLAALLEYLDGRRRSPKELGEQPDPAPQQGSGQDAPIIAANPNPVPAGTERGTTKISWNAGAGGSSCEVYVSTNGRPEQLFSGGAQGSQEASWIAADTEYEFRLYIAQPKTLLATVKVTQESDLGESAPTANTAQPWNRG